MNTAAQTLAIAIITVAGAAAIGMGLAERTAQAGTEIVKLERVVVLGKRAVEPVVTAVLPRVVVTGHSVSQADVQLASAL